MMASWFREPAALFTKLSSPHILQRMPAISSHTSRMISRSISTARGPLLLHVSAPDFAEPLKKKRRIDPAVLELRETRRRTKLQRESRRLKKFTKRLKPIMEIVGDRKFLRDLESRRRDESVVVEQLEGLQVGDEEITSEEQPSTDSECRQKRLGAERELLLEWGRHTRAEHSRESAMYVRMYMEQEKALKALREVSEEQWLEALKLDHLMLPVTIAGPVETPPIVDYEAPDGEYTETTNTFYRKPLESHVDKVLKGKLHKKGLLKNK